MFRLTRLTRNRYFAFIQDADDCTVAYGRTPRAARRALERLLTGRVDHAVICVARIP